MGLRARKFPEGGAESYRESPGGEAASYREFPGGGEFPGSGAESWGVSRGWD